MHIILSGCLALGAMSGETALIKQQHTPPASSFSYAYQLDSTGYNISEIITADKKGRFSVYRDAYPFYLGYLTKTCWLRLRVENTDPLPVTLFWNIYRDIDTLSLFEVSDSGSIIREHPFTSVNVPIAKREVKVRSLSFDINLQPHEAKILYLRIVNKGDVLQMPMSLTTLREYYEHEQPFFLLYGGFFGIYFFAVFVNLLLWFFIRDPLYLWYAGYVLTVMLFLCMDTYLESYLLPGWLFTAANTAGRLFVIFMLFTMQAGMAQRMIGLGPLNSRFYEFMNLLVKVLFVCALSALGINFLRYQISTQLVKVFFGGAIIASGIAIVMFFVTIGEQILKGNRLALYYAGSCFLLLVCVLNYFLGLFNLAIPFLFDKNGLAFGLTFEVLALAAMVGYRFYLLNLEKLSLLTENELRQEQLTAAVVNAHEDEKANIARNLHDGPVSYLMALHMFINQKLYEFKEKKGAIETVQTLGEIQTRLDKSIRDVRDVSHHLMPQEFEVNNLVEIIQSHLQTVENATHVHFELMADEKINALPKSVQLHLYRIVSELVNNILRHSHASEATIQFLTTGDKIQLMVEDDGIGIKASNETYGIGLKNITTRVQLLKGKLTIDSSKMGTVIIIEIPYNE